MAGGAPVAMLLGNGPGIPLAYVVVSVILVIFAVGYTAMARHHTSTGAFYSFVSRGLRQPAGARRRFYRAARLQRHADWAVRSLRGGGRQLLQ
jgi:amino acid transporter